MKLHIRVLFTVFYWCILVFQETVTTESIELETFKSNEIYQDDMFSQNMFEINPRPLISPRKFRMGKAIDCFGVGGRFAKALNWFLRKEANGTRALKVKFYASSRYQPKRITTKHTENFILGNLDFDIRRRTFFIVHGFLSNGNENWIVDMTKAFLKWDDVNVFAVDWSDGANTWNYFKAAVNTQVVGDQIATFIGKLVESVNASEIPANTWGSLHLVGHSLGAHICGYAAKELKERGNKWRPERITGLDPAQPCFKNSPKSLRLDVSDAPLVDVIHTNGRVLSRLGLGIPNPLGHVDFYPNGGKIQPGCILSESSLWNYLPLPIKKITETICSHGRSYLYFIDSIMSIVRNDCIYWAQKWDLSHSNIEIFLNSNCNDKKCMEMGINAEKYSLNGTFLSITGRSKPFCLIDKNSTEEIKNIFKKVTKSLHTNIDFEEKNKTIVLNA